MDVAAKPRCAVVFLMLLTLGVSVGLPAEDILDIVYDESEPAPSELIPLFSIAPQVVTPRTQAPPRPLLHELVVGSPFSPAQFPNTHAPRSTDSRVLLNLLCLLIC